MAQTNFYPCDETATSLCQKCNAGLTSPQGTNGTNGSKSSTAATGKNNSYNCEAYCNTSCNTKHCQTSQAYCDIGHELIKNHGDVGSYDWDTINSNDIILNKWTSNYWNSLIGKIESAETVGKKQSHGSAGTISACIGNKEAVSAALYNQVNKKLCNFNVSYNEVNIDDLITKTIANAIKTAYNAATFGPTVCDVCNSTSSQAKKECICNCPTCSSCPTCSTCPSCSCNCSCNCSSCSCGCTCSGCNSCPCSAGPGTENGGSE